MNFKTFLFKTAAIAAVAVLSAFHSLGSRAQSLEPFNPYGVFSPSVEAWQMTRYGNLSPSLYTGAMTFSLPLYTYSDPDFTIPISLEYSFDGYRPAQHSGTVGYGWYLSCGGVITREVRGIPDEGDLDGNRDYQCLVRGWRQTPTSVRDSMAYYSHKIYSAHRLQLGYVPEDQCQGLLSSYNTFSDLPEFAPGATEAMGATVIYDTAPDIYRFRFLGHSGAFMMLPDGSVEVFDSDLPHGELSVSFDDSVTNPAYLQITINTGDGYSYTFSTAGVNRIPNLTDDMPFRAAKSVNEYCLVRITAPNGRRVMFSHTPISSLDISRTYGPEGSVQYLVQTLYDHGDGGTSTGTSYFQNPVPWTVVQGSSSSPSLITVDGMDGGANAATISLAYTSASNEFAPGCFSQSVPAAQYGTASTLRLSSISVTNGSGETVEQITLTHHSHPYGTPKLFLDSVRSLRGGTHSFEYNLAGCTLPANDTQDTDHWGFWNGSGISDLRSHLTECTDVVLEPAHDEYIDDGDSVIVIHVPAHTVKGTAYHLYDQTVDNAKEASFNHAMCGALTQITYPTGGTTSVEYEANAVSRRLNRHAGSSYITLEPADSSNTGFTRTVGGVRVKSLSDSDGSGAVRTSTFSYADPQGLASGILMQMPRYCEKAQYIHRVNSNFAGNGVSAVALTTITSFSNSLFPLSTDAHVAYPHVCVTHPDGSYTRHIFSSVEQSALMDGRNGGFTVVKHAFCDHDWIEATDQGSVASHLVPVSVDNRAMRGKPLSETTFDAAGTPVHGVSYTYSSYGTTVPLLCFNNTTCFNLAPYTAVCPLLIKREESLHGVTTTLDCTYNTLGQRTAEECIAGTGHAADTVRTYFHYLHETVDSTSLTAALSSASRVRIADGEQHLIASEDYSYGAWPTLGNPKPTSILQRSTDGSMRTTTVGYDARFRPDTLTFPGGASIVYTWNGNNLQSRTDNGAGNTTAFTWKDLVGPSLITAPSGASTTYNYDNRMRLRGEKDSRGNAISTYNYKLSNE